MSWTHLMRFWSSLNISELRAWSLASASLMSYKRTSSLWFLIWKASGSWRVKFNIDSAILLSTAARGLACRVDKAVMSTLELFSGLSDGTALLLLLGALVHELVWVFNIDDYMLWRIGGEFIDYRRSTSLRRPTAFLLSASIYSSTDSLFVLVGKIWR